MKLMDWSEVSEVGKSKHSTCQWLFRRLEDFKHSSDELMVQMDVTNVTNVTQVQ